MGELTPCFPSGSACKESTCHAGNLGLIPALGRSPGEGKGYPLQYSGLGNSMDCIVHGVTKSQTRLSDFHFHFTSLVAQMVKNLLAMQETHVRSLGQDDPLENPMDRGAWRATVRGVTKSRTRRASNTFTFTHVHLRYLLIRKDLCLPFTYLFSICPVCFSSSVLPLLFFTWLTFYV